MDPRLSLPVGLLVLVVMGTCVTGQDVDECAAGTHNCPDEATCTNTEGGFTCDCNVGYQGDGFLCIDIDECVDGTHNCHSQATCTNTEGGFTCTCNVGYEGDGVSCTDVDECREFTTCHSEATCTNTPGSFTCTCHDGHSGDGFTCTDDDECTDGTHNCPYGATCINTEGGFNCICDASYSGDRARCTEQRVYLTTHGNLAFYKILATGPMSNTNVKATCVAAGMRYPCYYSGITGCTSSYWTSDCTTYSAAVDTALNRCLTLSALAIKLCGNYQPRFCQPLDETFVYIPGWYYGDRACGVDYDTSRACLFASLYHNKYALCAAPVDSQDECADGTHNCHLQATCTNIPGGFTCTCNDGYSGEGVSCTALSNSGCSGLYSSLRPAKTFGRYQNMCFWSSTRRNQKLNYRAARQECESHGGTLAMIKNSGVQRFLTDHLRRVSGRRALRNYWMGLDDLNREGRFVWNDGTPLGRYRRFRLNTPHKRRDCVVLWRTNRRSRWNILNCQKRLPYICQMDYVSK